MADMNCEGRQMKMLIMVLPLLLMKDLSKKFIFSRKILHLQQLQQGQQVQGYRPHHGLQRVPRLHEHPGVRLLPENRKDLNHQILLKQ